MVNPTCVIRNIRADSEWNEEFEGRARVLLTLEISHAHLPTFSSLLKRVKYRA